MKVSKNFRIIFRDEDYAAFSAPRAELYQFTKEGYDALKLIYDKPMPMESDSLIDLMQEELNIPREEIVTFVERLLQQEVLVSEN